MSLKLKIEKCTPNQAYSNRVYVNPDNFHKLTEKLKLKADDPDPKVNISITSAVGLCIFQCSPLKDVPIELIWTNSGQREIGQWALATEVSLSVCSSLIYLPLQSLNISVKLVKETKVKTEINADEISDAFKKNFKHQIFSVGQKITMNFNAVAYFVYIDKLDLVNPDATSTTGAATNKLQQQQITKGQLDKATTFSWKKHTDSQTPIVFTGATQSQVKNDSLFNGDFDFEKLGIGGLGAQFQTIFRRAFASRIFPGVYKDVGINHIRGMLLYGPPGCGKTLIARKIGKALNAREPKIINGPEVLDKYVGGSEEKVRALFIDAEKEQAEMGDDSQLHIIIFDEMDAVMKKRGSGRDSTGTTDSVVNQLLSKIDGVDSLNNILIIGMTNRKDMIDEAILRPGRLELHIEISLPDEDGRQQIINIHTQKLKDTNRITSDCIQKIKNKELASITKNYTGAELEGLIKNAFSYSISRHVDPSNFKQAVAKNIQVEWMDMVRAVDECLPAFGSKENDEILGMVRNGIVNYGYSFSDLWGNLLRLVNQTKTSLRTPLLSVLLEGNVGTGKTAIAAQSALDSGFPFIRVISADAMIGFSESQKCELILKTFVDSYKSPLSIIFIDDIERIIEYSPVGPRFSNTVLQCLLILIRKVPPKPPVIIGVTIPDPRLLILATTSIATLLSDIQLTQAFNVELHVSQLQSPKEIEAVLSKLEYTDLALSQIKSIAASINKPIGIKQLMMVMEMARSDDQDDSDGLTANKVLECLQTIGF